MSKVRRFRGGQVSGTFHNWPFGKWGRRPKAVPLAKLTPGVPFPRGRGSSQRPRGGGLLRYSPPVATGIAMAAFSWRESWP